MYVWIMSHAWKDEGQEGYWLRYVMFIFWMVKNIALKNSPLSEPHLNNSSNSSWDIHSDLAEKYV